MEWKEVTIADVCTVKRGASPRPIQNFMCKDGMPWVKIADATKSNSRYIYSTEEYITEAGVSKSRTVTPGTLIVSNSATPGLPKIMGITGCVHDGWLIIDDYNGVLKEYMYYKFIDIRRVLSNQANGSVFMNLKTDIVKKFPINLPCIDEQKKIVAILENIDAKIECNQKICENLEAQAQALFKHWFIDFAPFKNGKFVESELGMIPEGWRVGRLTEIAEYMNGLAMQKFPPLSADDAIPVLKIKELGQSQCDNNSDKCSKQIKPEYIIKNGDVVFSWSGTLMVDIWCGGICGLNQHLFKVTSDNYPKWFFFRWTKHHLSEFIRIAKDKAVTMGHIKRGDLEKAFVVIPDRNTLDKMSEVMENIHNLIINTRLESSRLATLRDTLLPKLMSGEIKV